MSGYVIEEYPHVHDNEILSYQVTICDNLKMHTRYLDKEEVTITFTGLMAHHFEHVTYSNIVLGISQITIDYFMDENKAVLEEGLRYAFPIFALSCEALRAHLKEKEMKVFYIDSSMGLSGFVIAKDIAIELRAV